MTVLYSSEVLDVMYTDFPEKYEELREYMRLKHAKELSNRQRGITYKYFYILSLSVKNKLYFKF